MDVINTFMTWLFKNRINQIDKFKKYPIDIQQELFSELIKTAKKTDFGKKYGFSDIRNYSDFSRQVPVHDYEQMKPYIEETMRGKQNVIWPSTAQASIYSK